LKGELQIAALIGALPSFAVMTLNIPMERAIQTVANPIYQPQISIISIHKFRKKYQNG